MTGNATVGLFLTVAILLATAKLIGLAAVRLGQPAVLGEIVAGIAAGPLLPDSMWHRLLAPDVLPLVNALAMIGLALFMFVVGYELEGALLRGRARSAVTVAAGSVLVPLAGGTLVALPLVGRYATGSHLGFVLFLGVAMSVTAFPVLARVLTERGLERVPLGGLALAAAAVGDVAAWLGLAAVAALCGHGGQWHVGFLPVYVLILLTVVRPLLRRLFARAAERGVLQRTLLTVLSAGLPLSCAATEWMGVHYIFGAFAFGVILPRTGPDEVRASVIDGLGQFGGQLLLPLYFVISGSKVDLSGIGVRGVAVLVLLVAVAVATKIVGAYVGGGLAGLGHTMSVPLAILMNIRGLTEIVMLSAGLDLGLIDRRVYSMMVLMAIVTTAMAGPALNLARVGTTPSLAAGPRRLGGVPGGGPVSTTVST
ncbi:MULTISPECIES: cation:proton antiporter [unclassified Frankia]|uniref:cation:proton antiporter n=1 Tax=unclassified Frankia TaxID=2632575 RepID=UPI001EF5243F|nr:MULTISPECIES: cation:proton antiporter [unclassified Frankia]